ncbi:MAG: transketolase [Bacteroidales bacterium]|nr:transketolase [Bacteroidales bacterium]
MTPDTDLTIYDHQGQVASLFNLYLPDKIATCPELMVITADMSYAARLERFKALYPDHFVNCGIAEANMIGVAAGLTEEGHHCIALAQAAFITMRCYEQVRQFMSYMRYPIILVGLSAGLQMQFMGNTHYAIEDMAIMRCLPYIEVLSPADASEAVKAMDYALATNRPTYIRLAASATDPLIYHTDFNYNPHQAHTLRQGTDIVLYATGGLVHQALQAATDIEQQTGVSTAVVDMHSIAPLDTQAILQRRNCRLMVSLEEHHTIGGLGSAIAEILASLAHHAPLLRLGVENRYSTVGDHPFLLDQHSLTAQQITSRVVETLKQHKQ